MKLCKDCKHIGKSILGTMNYCKRSIEVNLTDGSVKFTDNYCGIERKDGCFWSSVLKLCGKEGRFFDGKGDRL